MNLHLAMLRPSRDGFPGDATDGELEVVAAHSAYLARLRDEDVVLLAGRTQDERPLGLVVLRLDSAQEAERVMADDPAVRAGVFHCEIRPYEVAIWPFSEST